jgi:cysteine desulfurase
MSLERVYLDYNATSPLLPVAREAMVAALDLIGNPSSIHAEGRMARRALETSRASVAALMGVRVRDVVFTSGGTEAANLLLTPSLGDGGLPLERLFVCAGEHACVLQGHRFTAAQVEVVPMTAQGTIDLTALSAMLAAAAPARVMLALQAANNETGVVQPMREASDIVHAAGGLVVCDAVQAAGRIDISPEKLGADAVFMSAHKIGGPKGVAALAFANTRLHIGQALVRGGGQERGVRAGTENVAAIAAFGAAAEWALSYRETEMERHAGLRNALEAEVGAAFPDVVVFGRGAERLAQTSSLAVPGVPAETLLIALDLGGVAVSSGSACSSGKVQPSHVLAAMGIDLDLAKGALRVSFGWASSEKDVQVFCETFEKSVRNIRARQMRSAA